MMDDAIKGSWKLAEGDIYDSSDDSGFTITMGESNFTIHFLRYAEETYPEDPEWEEARRIARLIAAAPELLEVVTQVVERSHAAGSMGVDKETLEEMARAAFDKATSE